MNKSGKNIFQPFFYFTDEQAEIQKGHMLKNHTTN